MYVILRLTTIHVTKISETEDNAEEENMHSAGGERVN